MLVILFLTFGIFLQINPKIRTFTLYFTTSRKLKMFALFFHEFEITSLSMKSGGKSVWKMKGQKGQFPIILNSLKVSQE